MAGFRSIAAVGRSIEAVLTAGFAVQPPIVGQTTRVRLVQTDELDNQAAAVTRPALTILLYRVDFDKTMRATWSAVGAAEGRAHLPVDLHFLMTAWATNAVHEHQIIGRTMQLLEEIGALSGPMLDPDGEWTPNEAVQLYLEDMPTDDLMRTFESLTCEFRLSIPYQARVVVVSTPPAVPVPAVLTDVRGLNPRVPGGRR